jgi:hypothetical protein
MDIRIVHNPLSSVNLAEFRASASKLPTGALVALAIAFFPLTASAGIGQHSSDSPAIAAQWTFSRQEDGSVIDKLSGAKAQVNGNSYLGMSPVGGALQFDGYTGRVIAPPISALDRTSGFSVSAWVQLEAYPWNRVPILDQETSHGSFFFGIDEVGHLVTKIGSSINLSRSDLSIPLRRWTLVTENIENEVATFTINGAVAKSLPITDTPTRNSSHIPSNDLIIAHVRAPLLPGAPKSIHPDLPVEYSIEGSLGELTIYQSPLAMDHVKALLALANPELLKPKPWAQLPRWSGGPGSFGAFTRPSTSIRYGIRPGA